MSLPGGVSWVPGTAGASQTCGEVCADAPEVGDCANEALAACWLDDTCATHAAAREDAGAAASTTCVECGPTEWMDDGNAYCYPGVISGGSSGVAYWGASIVGTSISDRVNFTPQALQGQMQQGQPVRPVRLSSGETSSHIPRDENERHDEDGTPPTVPPLVVWRRDHSP